MTTVRRLSPQRSLVSFCVKMMSWPKTDAFASARTLTDPWKKEREVQTMDPDDLIRNEQLVEKLREGEMSQRKPTSRDVEDMRRARDAFDAFDASERKEREEKRERD